MPHHMRNMAVYQLTIVQHGAEITKYCVTVIIIDQEVYISFEIMFAVIILTRGIKNLN